MANIASMAVEVLIGARLAANFRTTTQEAISSFGKIKHAAEEMTSRLTSIPSILLGGAIIEGVKGAIQWDHNLTAVRKNADMTAESTKALGDELMNLSRYTGQSRNNLLEGFTVLSQRGMEAKDASNYIRLIGDTATASGAEMKDLATSVDVMVRTLGINKIDDLKSALDSMYFAGKTGIVELKEQARFMPTLAAQMINLGVSGKQASNDLAAMLQITAKGAGNSEEAFHNLMNVFQKETARETMMNLEKYSGIFGKPIRSDVIISTSLAAGKDPLITWIGEIKKVVDSIKDPGMRAKFISDIFSDMQVRNAMLPLMQNYDELKKLIADMDSPVAKGGLLRDKIIEMDSVSFKAQKALHALKAFGGQIGATLLPVITGLARIAQPFLTVIGWIAEHFPKITAATITGLALVYIVGIERSLSLASALGLVSVQSANAMRGLMGVTAATRGLAVAEGAAIATNTALAASTAVTATAATAATASTGAAAGAALAGGAVIATSRFKSVLGLVAANKAKIALAAAAGYVGYLNYNSNTGDTTGKSQREVTDQKTANIADSAISVLGTLGFLVSRLTGYIGLGLYAANEIPRMITGKSGFEYAQQGFHYLDDKTPPWLKQWMNDEDPEEIKDGNVKPALAETTANNGKIDIGGEVRIILEDNRPAKMIARTHDPRIGFGLNYDPYSGPAMGIP